MSRLDPYLLSNHSSQATFGERCAADRTASLSAFSLRRSGKMWLVLIRFSCMIARLDPQPLMTIRMMSRLDPFGADPFGTPQGNRGLSPIALLRNRVTQVKGDISI